ncbi:MAG TPA: hypothetical protein VGU73_10860 [Acidimicrobiia bacterium]|nr:hypothetical protein [Acidimicrobiia bacterium]
MDLNKLSRGDTVIGISAILLFIFSFFNWLGVNIKGAGIGSLVNLSGAANAWHFTLAWLAVLLGLVMLAYVVMKALGVEIPDKFGNVTLAQILLGIAAVAFLFVLIKLIAGPNIGTVPSFVTKSRKIGIFLGLIATIGLLGGAFLNFQESNA